MWTPPSRLLAARVAGQFGPVTRAQAIGGGVTKAIECHLDSGRWIRLHAGVYLTTPGRDDWEVRATAAVLWAGEGAALTRASAGYAWGLVRAEPPLLEVVVPAHRMVQSLQTIAVTRSRYARTRVDGVRGRTASPHHTRCSTWPPDRGSIVPSLLRPEPSTCGCARQTSW